MVWKSFICMTLQSSVKRSLKLHIIPSFLLSTTEACLSLTTENIKQVIKITIILVKMFHNIWKKDNSLGGPFILFDIGTREKAPNTFFSFWRFRFQKLNLCPLCSFVCLFVCLGHNYEFFTYMETSPLLLKGCKF